MVRPFRSMATVVVTLGFLITPNHSANAAQDGLLSRVSALGKTVVNGGLSSVGGQSVTFLLDLILGRTNAATKTEVQDMLESLGSQMVIESKKDILNRLNSEISGILDDKTLSTFPPENIRKWTLAKAAYARVAKEADFMGPGGALLYLGAEQAYRETTVQIIAQYHLMKGFYLLDGNRFKAQNIANNIEMLKFDGISSLQRSIQKIRQTGDYFNAANLQVNMRPTQWDHAHGSALVACNVDVEIKGIYNWDKANAIGGKDQISKKIEFSPLGGSPYVNNLGHVNTDWSVCNNNGFWDKVHGELAGLQRKYLGLWTDSIPNLEAVTQEFGEGISPSPLARKLCSSMGAWGSKSIDGDTSLCVARFAKPLDNKNCPEDTFKVFYSTGKNSVCIKPSFYLKDE